MVVAEQRLNHHLCGLIEMVFGDHGDDLVTFATPRQSGLGEKQEDGQEES
jgi:hypothetical protein